MADYVRDAPIVNDWVRVARWARLGASTTAVAITLATYANPDGTRVYPGSARLALDCEVDTRTVERALRKLRTLGLITRVGRRPRSQVTDYRLTLPPLDQLRQHITVPTVDEYDTMIATASKARRNTTWRQKCATPQSRTPTPVENQPCATPESRTPECARQANPDVRDTSPGVPTSDPPPSNPPSDAGDLRTDLKVVDDPEPVDNPDPADQNGETMPTRDRPQPDPVPDYGTCPRCGAALDPDRTCFVRHCPGPTTVDDDGWPTGTTRHRPR